MEKKIFIIIGTIDLDGASTWLLNLLKYDERDVINVLVLKKNNLTVKTKEVNRKIIELDSKTKYSFSNWFKIYSIISEKDIIVNVNPHTLIFSRVLCKLGHVKHVSYYQNRIRSFKLPVRILDKISTWFFKDVLTVGVSSAITKSLNVKNEIFTSFNSSEVINLAKSKKRLRKDNIKFLNVGRFHQQKNQIQLILAFNHLYEKGFQHELHIVGWGKMKNEIQRKIKSPYIKLIKPREDIGLIFSNADVFIMPSLYEGLSLAAVEAIGYSLPLIVSKIDEFNDLASKENSIRIDGFGCQEILASVEKFLTLSEIEILKMGEESFLKYSKYFNVEKNSIRLINKLLNS